MVELVPTTPGSLKLVDLERTLGVFFIGYIFMMVLYGFTFFQSYMYYSRYPKDPWSTKSIVILLALLDTAVSVLISQSLYYYMVNLFPYTLTIEFATTTFCLQMTLAAISILIAQLYYAYAVHQASKNLFGSAAIAILATAGFALGLATSIQLFIDRDFSHMTLSHHKAIAATSYALVSAAGILTFVFLSLYRLPAHFRLDKDIFDTFVSYLVSRGGAAFVVHLALLFVFIGVSGRIYWIPFYMTSTKFFVVGAMTLINSREDAQTVTSDFMASGGTGGATRTIGGSTIQQGGTSGLEFKPKSAIVIDVTQTQHSEVNQDKMAFMGDAHSTNSEGVLDNKNAALYH